MPRGRGKLRGFQQLMGAGEAGVVSEGGRAAQEDGGSHRWSPPRFGFGQCRNPRNREAHLVIEKMKKVIIKCSFAGSHEEDNG